jgi:toxin HigB-1
MIRIHLSGVFTKQYNLIKIHKPLLLPDIYRTIQFFRKNPQDTRLSNHPLRKTLYGKWAFSISNEYRIVYKWIGKNTVRFLLIGTHQEVYG